MDFLFWFGWLGPILVVVSLAVPNVMWFRVLNLIGSTIAAMTSVNDCDEGEHFPGQYPRQPHIELGQSLLPTSSAQKKAHTHPD